MEGVEKFVLDVVNVVVCEDSSEGMFSKVITLEEFTIDEVFWIGRVGGVGLDIDVCFVVRVVLIAWTIVVRNSGDSWEERFTVIDKFEILGSIVLFIGTLFLLGKNGRFLLNWILISGIVWLFWFEGGMMWK